MNAPLAESKSLDRRFVFGAIGAAVLLFVVAPAFAAWLALKEDIDQSKAEIVSAETLYAEKPALEAELDALRLRARTAPGLLAGDSPALAQADLAGQMKTVIESNRGVLMSAEMIEPSKQSDFDRVAIAYDLTIPFSHLKRFLYAVETHAPYFFFDDADIRIPANWHPATQQLPDPMVEVHCTVHAYRWRGRA